MSDLFKIAGLSGLIIAGQFVAIRDADAQALSPTQLEEACTRGFAGNNRDVSACGVVTGYDPATRTVTLTRPHPWNPNANPQLSGRGQFDPPLYGDVAHECFGGGKLSDFIAKGPLRNLDQLRGAQEITVNLECFSPRVEGEILKLFPSAPNAAPKAPGRSAPRAPAPVTPGWKT